MKKYLFAFASIVFTASIQAQSINLTTPVGSVSFGTSVTVLSNGNYVVTDPDWRKGLAPNVGAVYLYDGRTNALISTLTGSQINDHVGINGITVLSNGNYVVSSTLWGNGGTIKAGAVTWCNGQTGVNGVVSSANSLVGTSVNDYVGEYITVLNNGNYVVRSNEWDNGNIIDAGVVTWGNGNYGVNGAVSSANSLVGASAYDRVGFGGITALKNGNYLVISTAWDNGNIINAGAVTWGNGISGVKGTISSNNSLIGSHINDQVGHDGIVALTNGNYVVKSGDWDNGGISDAGAVTWGNGTTGVKGEVNSVNSLVGSTLNDAIGHVRGVTILNNGNYVVNSFNWDNGNIINAGAATWGNGNSGISGVISSANSLVGSKPNDSVGCGGTTALTNGNYVVSSFKWDNGSIYNAGAVTWGNGNNGTIGLVSIYNSLVGSNANDKISYNETGEGISALSNGNYVVNSYLWDNGSVTDAGAVTWGNGTSGIRGAVSIANSLIGSTTKDYVGLHGVTALRNGNYVVQSDYWQNYRGAATWCNGLIGRIGSITSANSLVGTTSNDRVGAYVTQLNNGNYVIASYSWHNGNIESAGAVTWGDGNTGVNGVVSSANSLVGNKTNDFVGYGGVIALANGGYVVVSNHWNNGIILNAGAVTKGYGNISLTGVISSANSLVGSHTNDNVGDGNPGGVTALTNGNYVVLSSKWDNGAIANAGAVTWGNGSGSTTGPITTCNSVVGNLASSYLKFAYNYTYEKLIVTKSLENIVTIFAPSQSTLAMISTNARTNANGTTTLAFVDNNCKLIAALKPAGALPVVGTIEAKVYVEKDAFPGSDGKAYVSRHYDISPSTSPENATSTITLYYTQAEFDNYNIYNGKAPDLPTNPTDETGKSHVNITQQHGTSQTGDIDTYNSWNGTGPANVTINPGAENVVWNTNLMRWEITFDVTGFSGFFLRGDKNYPLAVSLVNFSAKEEGIRNRLDWNTEDEAQGITFEVERSFDGISFVNLGQVTGKGKSAAYVFYDEAPINGNNYYRLKMVELSGEASYSNVVLVKRNDHSADISVFPNPADNILNIKYSKRELMGTSVTALDLQGRTMATTILTTSTVMNIQKWPAGIYMLRFVDGSVVKVVKK